MKDNKQVKKSILSQLNKYNEAMLDAGEQKEVKRLLDKVAFTGLDFFTEKDHSVLWAYLFEVFEESRS